MKTPHLQALLRNQLSRTWHVPVHLWYTLPLYSSFLAGGCSAAFRHPEFHPAFAGFDPASALLRNFEAPTSNLCRHRLLFSSAHSFAQFGMMAGGAQPRTALDEIDDRGAFQRTAGVWQNEVDAAGPFTPDAGRYHLYISLACPWAAGVLTALYMKGLDSVISHSIVHPTWARTRPENPEDTHSGWHFRAPGDAPVPNLLGIDAGCFGGCKSAASTDVWPRVATCLLSCCEDEHDIDEHDIECVCSRRLRRKRM